MADLNLNSQLISNESPLTGNKVIPAMDYDSQTERDSVTSAHIKNFSFNSGTGGTLTLAAGMSIVNSLGTTIVDQYGLNSSNVFAPVGTRIDDGTVAGTTPTVCGTLGTIILPRASNIFVYMFGYIGCKETLTETSISATIGNAVVHMDVGTAGTLIVLTGSGQRTWSDGGTAASTSLSKVSQTRIKLMDAGTHVVKLYAWHLEGGTCVWDEVFGGYCNFGI